MYIPAYDLELYFYEISIELQIACNIISVKMSNLAESRLLRISSKDRADTSRSRYNIDFRTNDNELHQISRIVLKSIVVPNTQYNINLHTNTLYLPTSLSEVTKYTIKPGQYKTNDLITELKKVVNDTVGGGFNITQDPISFFINFISYSRNDGYI